MTEYYFHMLYLYYLILQNLEKIYILYIIKQYITLFKLKQQKFKSSVKIQVQDLP
jgi:hypothetical protein